MKDPEYIKILAEKSGEVDEAIAEFVEQIDQRTEVENIDDFLTMDMLEAQWDELESKTKKIYSNLIKATMAKVNEKRLIESKKENSQKGV